MIINKINGKDVTPMGKQKAFLLDILDIEKCNSYGLNWNGYGYKDKVRDYSLTPYEIRKYKSLAPKIAKPKKSSEEKMQLAFASWCKRLVKLTGISIEEAVEIANEKLEYKENRINMMRERDNSAGWPSKKRNQLIKKMERENPLRRIEDEAHARAILAASHRHKKTNYEALLEEAHELELIGDVERGTAKEFAREKLNQGY